MARIRTVKPEFIKHYELYQLEKESGLPCRLAFQGLWIVSDKNGVFKWQPEALKLDALPYDPIDFSIILEKLLEKGFIVKFKADDGKYYGWVPSFKNHQRIVGTEATNESKYPCPPTDYKNGDIVESLENHEGSNLESQEGKGREGEREREGKGIGNGRERELPEKNNSAEIPTIFHNGQTIIFSLAKIYEKNWEEYNAFQSKSKNKVSEIMFIKWKEFVDFILENDYVELFKAKFVSPSDFVILLTSKGFLQQKWKDVIERMLSSGITSTQNLFFRIPQFLNYGNGKTAGGGKGNTEESKLGNSKNEGAYATGL